MKKKKRGEKKCVKVPSSAQTQKLEREGREELVESKQEMSQRKEKKASRHEKGEWTIKKKERRKEGRRGDYDKGLSSRERERMMADIGH